MFTMIAYSGSVDHAAVLTKLAGVSDQHIKVAGTQVTVGKLNQIIGEAAYIGAISTEARLISPSLRRTNPFYIMPIEQGLVPADTPAISLHPDNPIPLDVNEALEAEHDGNPAAAEQTTIGVLLSDGKVSPATGEIIVVNATITLAQLAGAWSFSEITFPDTLPVADYSVVGARVIAAGGVLFRFVPVGESHRPGGIVAQGANDKDAWEMRYGRMGEWFKFNTVQPPGVEMLSSAAAGAATYQIYLDVIKG